MLAIVFLALSIFGTPANDCLNKDCLEDHVSESSVVFIGEVIELGDHPPFWSSLKVMLAQKVRYKVKKVLKGDLSDNELVVSHYLVKGNPHIDKDVPQMSPELFFKGAEFIIFVEPHPDCNCNSPDGSLTKEFLEVDSECGAITLKQENLEKVLQIIERTQKNMIIQTKK